MSTFSTDLTWLMWKRRPPRRRKRVTLPPQPVNISLPNTGPGIEDNSPDQNYTIMNQGFHSGRNILEFIWQNLPDPNIGTRTRPNPTGIRVRFTS